ncbi:protein NDRG3 isoform X4 [Vespula squamosa]|uniref:Protein NDRG3 isoform X4 n=1 Tax=Vespula squamosa TaxID=30214 RepID=A0ABD2ADD6_VESSQ
MIVNNTTHQDTRCWTIHSTIYCNANEDCGNVRKSQLDYVWPFHRCDVLPKCPRLMVINFRNQSNYHRLITYVSNMTDLFFDRRKIFSRFSRYPFCTIFLTNQE